MTDIVQSQEKSMEGHPQFLLKVRGLKSKSLKQSTKHQWNFVGGGVGLQNKKGRNKKYYLINARNIK